MKNYKKSTVIVLLLVVVIAGTISFVRFRNKKEYEKDVAFLYEVAEKLGYTPTNHLNFYHNYAAGIDYAANKVQLLFTTQQILEDFTIRVDGLNFQGSLVQRDLPDQYFIGWGGVRDRLGLKEKDGSTEDTGERFYGSRKWPRLTKWQLREPGGKPVNIIYADTNERGDSWIHNDIILNGNVVQVELDRGF